jgi:hypothetical protein
MTPEGAAPPDRWRARRRLAVALWAVLAFVVWNVVFDAEIKQAEVDYLTRQALHQAGRGPAVALFAVMRPAVGHAARMAALWALPVAVAGIAATLFAARRLRARS